MMIHVQTVILIVGASILPLLGFIWFQSWLLNRLVTKAIDLERELNRQSRRRRRPMPPRRRRTQESEATR